MAIKIERTVEQINAEIDRAAEAVGTGVSNVPGMSYEEGVDSALRWVLGDTDDAPMDE